MSKDMLGATVRALVSVPEDRLGMVLDFANKAATGDHEWLNHAKKFLRGELADVRVYSSGQNDPIAQWTTLYAELFGLEVDLSRVSIPPKQEGFDRLILVPRELTLNQTFDVCTKLFKTWKCVEGLDEALSIRDRDPKSGSYAIWVKDSVESDKAFANASADNVEARGLKGETLLEHLLFTIKYFRETRKHLDMANWTLCTGSRSAGGRVPRVFWNGGLLSVRWSDCSDREPRTRVRQVVSL
jgi:hypothetical protein